MRRPVVDMTGPVSGGAQCAPMPALVMLSMLCLGVLPSVARSTEPQPVATPFDEDGYRLSTTLTKSGCLVVSSIDLATMVAKTGDLQAKGLIRADVDTAHVKSHAWSTASAFALKVEPIFVVTVFRNSPEINRCSFGQVYIGFDNKPEIAYTFIVTRAIYDKVDWTSFDATDLPSVVQDFKVGPVTAGHMTEESKLSD